MIDTTLKEASIGMCTDPANERIITGSWNKLDFNPEKVKLSTSDDSTGEWQFPSGTVCYPSS